MTWKELAEKILTWTEEQQNTDVTVYDEGNDEYLSVNHFDFAKEKDNDVLDEGHPFLMLCDVIETE